MDRPNVVSRPSVEVRNDMAPQYARYPERPAHMSRGPSSGGRTPEAEPSSSGFSFGPLSFGSKAAQPIFSARSLADRFSLAPRGGQNDEMEKQQQQQQAQAPPPKQIQAPPRQSPPPRQSQQPKQPPPPKPQSQKPGLPQVHIQVQPLKQAQQPQKPAQQPPKPAQQPQKPVPPPRQIQSAPPQRQIQSAPPPRQIQPPPPQQWQVQPQRQVQPPRQMQPLNQIQSPRHSGNFVRPPLMSPASDDVYYHFDTDTESATSEHSYEDNTDASSVVSDDTVTSESTARSSPSYHGKQPIRRVASQGRLAMPTQRAALPAPPVASSSRSSSSTTQKSVKFDLPERVPERLKDSRSPSPSGSVSSATSSSTATSSSDLQLARRLEKELLDKIDKLQSEAKDLQASNGRLSRELDETTDLLSAQTKETKELRVVAKDLEDSNSRLRRELTDTSESLSSQSFQSKENERTSNQERIHKEIALRDLQQQRQLLDEFRSNFNLQKGMLDSTEGERDSLRRAGEEYKMQIANLQKDMEARAQEQAAKEEARAQAQAAKEEELLQRIAAFETAAVGLEARIAGQTDEVKALTTERDALREDMRNHMTAIQVLAEEKKAFFAEKAALVATHEAFEEEKKRIAETQKDLEARLQQAEEDQVAMQAKIGGLEEALAGVEAEKQALSDQLVTDKAAFEVQLHDEKQALEEQLRGEKAAIETQLLEEKAAMEKQLLEEKEASEKQLLDDKAAMEAQLLEEKAALEKQLVDDKAAAETQLQEEKAAIETQLLAEKAAVETQLQEEKAAIETQLREEKAAVETQLQAEKAAIETQLQDEKAALERELAEEKADKIINVQRLEDDLQGCKMANVAIAEEKLSVEKRLGELLDRLSHMRSAMTASQTDVAALEARNQALESDKIETSNDLEAARNKHMELEGRITSLQADIAGLEERSKALESDVEQKTKEAEMTAKLNGELEEHARGLKVDLDTIVPEEMRARNKELEEAQGKMTEEKAALEARIAELQAEADKLPGLQAEADKVTALQAEADKIPGLSSQNQMLAGELHGLRHQLQDAHSARDALNMRIHDLEVRHKESKAARRSEDRRSDERSSSRSKKHARSSSSGMVFVRSALDRSSTPRDAERAHSVGNRRAERATFRCWGPAQHPPGSVTISVTSKGWRGEEDQKQNEKDTTRPSYALPSHPCHLDIDGVPTHSFLSSSGMATTSWVPGVTPDSPFSLANLPFGIISTADDATPRPAVAIGTQALDLKTFTAAAGAAWTDVVPELRGHEATLAQPTLNAFAALGRPTHRAVRAALGRLLQADGAHAALLEADAARRAQVLRPLAEVRMHLPMAVGDYTDFYAGYHHAHAVGCLFRSPAAALQPNYTHLPVGYHGRASSLVASGAAVPRPVGQILVDERPTTAPSRRLDFELELGCFVGRPNARGEPVAVDRADEDHVFGYVLLNDWSARDIQAWEYVPLGPFNGKNFASTISAWVVLADALEPYRARPIANPSPRQPYLDEKRAESVFDIELEVDLTTPEGDTTTITRTSARHLLWSFPQMLAHHTLGGCNLRTGDLLGSGTISGPPPASGEASASTPSACGSLLEMSAGGRRDVLLAGMDARRFLKDGDAVTLRGVCGPPGARVGFGDCTGRVYSAAAAGGPARS